VRLAAALANAAANAPEGGAVPVEATVAESPDELEAASVLSEEEMENVPPAIDDDVPPAVEEEAVEAL